MYAQLFGSLSIGSGGSAWFGTRVQNCLLSHVLSMTRKCIMLSHYYYWLEVVNNVSEVSFAVFILLRVDGVLLTTSLDTDYIMRFNFNNNMYNYQYTVISAAPSPFTPGRFSIGNKQNHHNTLLLQSSNVIRKYYCRPPHDTSLYDVLQVHTNATLIDIQKNWRRLSREYHPDKVAIRRRKRQRSEKKQYPPPPPPPMPDDGMIPTPPPPPSINQDEDETERYVKHKLEELTHAYEILSNDDSRLLYHKYGLVGGANEAIQILTGKDVGEVRNSADSEAFARLSELMGYPATTATRVSSNHQNDQSLHLVRTITERLRPLVEGISQDLFVAEIIRECNLIKKVGLGSQIIRCIGRAYRIEGYRVLRQMHHDKMSGRNRGSQHRHGRRNKSTHHEVADILTDTLREAKHLSQAALSHGRLMMTEQRIKRLEEEAQKSRKQREQRQRFKKIKIRDESIRGEKDDHFVSNIGSLSDNNEDIESEYDTVGFSDDEEEGDESDDHDDLEFDLHHEQNKKIHEALQQAQQIEALWKLHKMELSSTIRRACRLILEPTSSTFCPPPIPHSTYDQSRQSYDGWVSSTGRVVLMDVGRLRAAAALVLFGDILVQSSKEGTSWRKK